MIVIDIEQMFLSLLGTAVELMLFASLSGWPFGPFEYLSKKQKQIQKLSIVTAHIPETGSFINVSVVCTSYQPFRTQFL
ncbi:hypothetical protein LguiB_029173 [Lonicera macranthoides]